MEFQSCVSNVVGGNLPDGCLGIMMSKVLGYAVVFGSGMLKVPQVSDGCTVVPVFTWSDILRDN
jgi:hypothetical protein